MSLREFLVNASIGGGRNFRAVSGFRTSDGREVVPGRLFRSGYPGRLEEATRQLAHEARLRTLVTLQTRRELEVLEFVIDEVLPGVRWEHIPIGDHWFSDDAPYPGGLDEMGEFYLAMVLEHAPAWTRFFEILGRDDRLPALVHCTAGKDRTGVATLLVLETLGVPRETIRADYVRSNDAFESFHQDERVLDPLLDAIDRAGGIDTFLSELGVAPGAVDGVRRNLLEP